ncbi:ACP S-malonyltransferase [Desulfogranum japonicum]|uniref:ACP S-malonyltransferase n=1 Tax=Desulfogranum japonicum TaxID=231447 RepID=UPI0005558614|nr:ACP S-malonyltransferase [Desulfogranum japonicum]
MKKTAILFPGQGSQYIGMGQVFAENDSEAAQLFASGDRIAGLPIHKLCLEGPMADLTRVVALQPALTVINLICWQQLQKRLPDFVPACVAGHSLGEYSALHAAGVLSQEDTLKLVTKRGELMDREGNANPGGMRAILGLSGEKVAQMVNECQGRGQVVVANYNTPAQVVVSGDDAGLSALGELCKSEGAKVIPLKVSVANHSPLVAGAVPDFSAFMQDITFLAPKIPVIFNVTASSLDQPEDIKDVMAKQIASPVRWVEVIEQMVDLGVEVFVELGPKNVLTGMMKKILPRKTTCVCLQADTPETIEEVAACIAG